MSEDTELEPRAIKPRYDGVVAFDDGMPNAHLLIQGTKSLLTVVSNDPLVGGTDEYREFHGKILGGERVSLLSCIESNSGSAHRAQETQHYAEHFPHFVTIGETHLSETEEVIRSITYQCADFARFSRGREFGSINGDPDLARSIILQEEKRRQARQKEAGSSNQNPIPMGSHPHLSYYSGRTQIAKSKGHFGQLKISNRPTISGGGTNGVPITNQIVATLTFSNPLRLSQAIKKLIQIHRLFELSTGKRIPYGRIDLELTKMKAAGDREYPHRLELLWSYGHERALDEAGKADWRCSMLKPDGQTKEFVKVVSGWMDGCEDLHVARGRLQAASRHSFGIERIVGGANRFDLLPSSHAPSKRTPSEAEVDAVQKCREILLDLPESYARHSIMSALGRIRSLSLTEKILHRADIILSASPGRFDDLEFAIRQAVLCRNHYVHGSPASFNYEECFEAFAFITETMEFVFEASDLIELGWDMEAWLSWSPAHHPLGAYALYYDVRMRDLKNTLGLEAER